MAFPRLLRICRIAGFTLLAAAAAFLVTGCGINAAQLATSTTPTAHSIQGAVHGGSQGVTGAHIYIYAANTTGYGAASLSLLYPTYPGVSTDTYGSYVTTDAAGNFSVSGAYSCVPGQGVYILARGGNPGLPDGATNPSLTLIAPLGPCPDSGSLADAVPVVQINEVTTVAAAYALSGYMTDATHLSSSGTALAKQGVLNAFSTALNLVDLPTGKARNLSVVGNGTVPQATINTLANMLAACINSNGTTGSCPTLFTNAKTTTGSIPTDTASAAINIAHNPAANITPLFNLSNAAPPFQPTLATAPNDWTIGLTFYADLMAGPYYPAFDAQGNLWVPGFANNTVTEFNSLGIPLSGRNGFSGNAINQPFAIAIDSGQTAWIANFSYGNPGTVSRITANGASNDYFPCGTNCSAVAFDNFQNAWVNSASGIQTMHNSGVAISKFNTTGYAAGIAIDSAGRGWTIGATRNLYRMTLNNTLDQFPQTVTSTLPNDLNMLAIDANDTIWFTSGKNNALGRVDANGALLSPAAGYTGGGLKYPAQLAVDGTNRIWVANRDGNSISAFNNDGSAISPATGYQPSNQLPIDPDMPANLAGIRTPRGLAIDGAGNVWVTNFTNNSVTELVGAASPVITPISPTTHGKRP